MPILFWIESSIENVKLAQKIIWENRLRDKTRKLEFKGNTVLIPILNGSNLTNLSQFTLIEREEPSLETYLVSIKNFCKRYSQSNTSCDAWKKLPKIYMKYGNFILLKYTAFIDPSWSALLSEIENDKKDELYNIILNNYKGTRLAQVGFTEKDDLVRKPNCKPLYGDFGIIESDLFDDHFWCTFKQNGLYQTWAPMRTMFSKGNIKEKARVLIFPGLYGATVVDLYIGIGYFAFSYLKAGAKRVIGWDINRFSIEGLYRGAVLNKFSIDINPKSIESNVLLIIFGEDNKYAAKKDLLAGISVTHINLGLLPTSQPTWHIAAQLLDHEKGGYIHIHETTPIAELRELTIYCQKKFSQFLSNTGLDVIISHVEIVKIYSPGILHIVIDLNCKPNSQDCR